MRVLRKWYHSQIISKKSLSTAFHFTSQLSYITTITRKLWIQWTLLKGSRRSIRVTNRLLCWMSSSIMLQGNLKLIRRIFILDYLQLTINLKHRLKIKNLIDILWTRVSLSSIGVWWNNWERVNCKWARLMKIRFNALFTIFFRKV
jgi:hypothetical protein